MIFQEEARQLSRQVKEGLVRAYEDGWLTQKIFDPDTRRGRIRFEGQNVISYVAKAKEVADWLLRRGEEKLKLGSKEYLTTFKPWIPRQELRDLRLQEAEVNFWIVALRVQLDAYYYLLRAVSAMFGEVKAMHPPEFDRTRPKLMNVKFDMHPDTRFNVEDSLVIESPREKGERSAGAVEMGGPIRVQGGKGSFRPTGTSNGTKKKERGDVACVGGGGDKEAEGLQIRRTEGIEQEQGNPEMGLSSSSDRGRGFFRLNTQTLEDPGLRDWVCQHMASWEEAKHLFQTTEDWADGGLAIISGILNISSKILVKSRNQKEAECKRRVEEAEERMEGHPISALASATERERRLEEWENLQTRKERRWMKLLKEKGIKTSDKMNKETFQKLLPRRSMQQMVELKHPFDDTAPTASTTSGMLDYAKMYYADILTTRRPQDGVDTDLTEVSDFWEDTQVKLAATARLDMDRPLTLEETMQTLKSMARGKSPGIDGLTVEFYVKCWETVGPPLVELFNGVLVGGKLGKRMTRGVISVLFKKGDEAKVRNWRPISLLNVSYKILAKTLARRLGRYLPEMVKKDQGAFVQGRSIFNNIATTIEVLEVIQAENLDTTVLLLNLEKAYDKVGWTFVMTTLRHMGFGEGFCKWVAALYTFSTSVVMVNVHLSQPFRLTRSLRQGCPLAPLLFVLQIMEVLMNRIRKHRVIKGLTLNETAEFRVKALTDDLFAVCENTLPIMTALKSVMQEYSVLSEASVNWVKSACLLPAQFKLSVEWGMKRIEEGEEERFLGVLISLQVGCSSHSLLLQSRITAKLSMWGIAWHLSLIGRALVSNVALFSILWFVCTVKEMAAGILKTIQRLIARFLWKPYAKKDEGFIAKVTWELLTFPREQGGLGLWDPAQKNQAQLRGWVCKAAVAEVKEDWVLLAERLLMREWDLNRPEDVWVGFLMDSFRRKRPKSLFWKAILRAWKNLPPDVPTPPQTKEEVLAQHLFENPRVRSQGGTVLHADGSTSSFGLAWIKRGVSRVRDIWSSLLGQWVPLMELMTHLNDLRRVEENWNMLREAIPQGWLIILGPEKVDPTGTWYAAEDQEEDCVAWKVVGITPSGFRKVEEWQGGKQGNRLTFIREDTVQKWSNLPQIRVVERQATKNSQGEVIWIGKCTLRQLRIDPLAWNWSRPTTDNRSNPLLPMLDYNVSEGYNLASKATRTPAAVAVSRWEKVLGSDPKLLEVNFSNLWKALCAMPNGKQEDDACTGEVPAKLLTIFIRSAMDSEGILQRDVAVWLDILAVAHQQLQETVGELTQRSQELRVIEGDAFPLAEWVDHRSQLMSDIIWELEELEDNLGAGGAGG
ncbi:hypothetical protein CBR_g30231 [Chara braunii]|uniref:Reverse transcriptase domain-containing protein n=1 Tax=Chara braunii TaxID=69332 RepID=A0A388LCC6_CHABU|nr:hypothetical protein CBR_g30231 [Chara braunii]|eukprot:GBG79969.1 hypothetical protein CBR_g30231 [Chara braunii]